MVGNRREARLENAASGEIFGTYDAAAVARAIDGIYDTVTDICRHAAHTGATPEAVALDLAAERLAA